MHIASLNQLRRYKSVAVLLICILFISCTQSKKDETSTVTEGKTDSMVGMPVAPVASSPDNDTTIYRNLEKDVPITVQGKLWDKYGPVQVVLSISEGDSLFATMETPDPNTNMRINQIIMPDNKADGPFGRSLAYKISKKGNYTLLIGNNLMAEGNTEGEFILRIRAH